MPRPAQRGICIEPVSDPLAVYRGGVQQDRELLGRLLRLWLQGRNDLEPGSTVRDGRRYGLQPAALLQVVGNPGSGA